MAASTDYINSATGIGDCTNKDGSRTQRQIIRVIRTIRVKAEREAGTT